ncbi:MAG: VOC family protein [Chloroflexi bacterium]|nr:VOC family protein [Chloroflexota bacterium]
MENTNLEKTSTQTRIRITEMDHIVLRVRDIDLSLRFYTEVLGLRPERLAEFRSGKVRFPSVRLNEGTIIDLLPSPSKQPMDNSSHNQDHYCMVIEPTDMAELATQLQNTGVDVREGPVTRSGARGDGTSIYITDPDSNLIELRHY